MGARASAPLLVLVILVPAFSGCLQGGNHLPDGWWDAPGPATWGGTGLDRTPVQAAPTPWLEDLLWQHATRSEEIRHGPGDANGSSGRSGQPSVEFEAVRDRLAHGITTPTIDPAYAARVAALDAASDSGARAQADAGGERSSGREPADVQALVEQIDRTLDETNATALPWLVGLADAVQATWEAPGGRAEGANSSTRPSARAMASLAEPILENATTESGPSLHGIERSDLAPLFQAVDRNHRRIPSFDTAVNYSRLVWDLWESREASLEHRAWGLDRPAAAAALWALVHTQAAYRLYVDEIPNATEIRRSVRSLSDASGPLAVVTNHRAADAFRMALPGLEDPGAILPTTDRLLVPVATAELRPLIRELDGYLVTSDPIDWERTLEPHLERWRAAWGPIPDDGGV